MKRIKEIFQLVQVLFHINVKEELVPVYHKQNSAADQYIDID